MTYHKNRATSRKQAAPPPLPSSPMLSFERSYPKITAWVSNGGWVEIGYEDYTDSFVRALDEDGISLRITERGSDVRNRHARNHRDSDYSANGLLCSQSYGRSTQKIEKHVMGTTWGLTRRCSGGRDAQFKRLLARPFAAPLNASVRPSHVNCSDRKGKGKKI